MWNEFIALLRGNVRVRAQSRFPERILNVCSARGIPLREPRFVGEEELAFSVDRRDWRRLRAACADLGAEAHIERVAYIVFIDFYARSEPVEHGADIRTVALAEKR